MIRIIQTRSTIGTPEKQRRVIEALGLRKVGASVVRKDDAAIRGMIKKISHLVTVEKAD